MAHFSRYLKRGARILKTTVHPPASAGVAHRDLSDSDAAAPLVVAATDPKDGSVVVIALNPSKTDVLPYKLDIGGGRVAALNMPPRSLQTILVPPHAIMEEARV